MTVEPTGPALNVLLSTLKSIFRPSSPTDDPELFRGRERELSRLLSTVQEHGQHAVIYGERGVGKTSLAYMAKEAFQEATPGSLVVRVQCSADDNFATTWQKLVPRLVRELDVRPDAERSALMPVADRIEDILLADVTPDSAVRSLNLLAHRVPLLVIIDEFDRIGDFGSTQLFADTIKMASDDFLPFTLLIVGVADDVDGLIAGHRSVERSLRQVFMPRMSNDELTRIVLGGFTAFSSRSGHQLTAGEGVVDAVVRLSQGFPYYTHLLAGAIGEVALKTGTQEMTQHTVFDALFTALDEATQSIKVSYTDAVTSAKSDATFAQTILSCALAPVDELGFFAPADIAPGLTNILNRPRSTPDYLHHLKRFADAPSYILETRGEGRKARYRFHNPLMKPFVLMKGVRDGDLTLPTLS